MSISSKRNNLPLHMIQFQHWEDSIRILVTDEQHYGSIQAFIPHRTEDKPLDGEADALIYSLWVGERHRGCEVAKHLMEAVEMALKRYGIETVAISWDGRDSPPWVLQWYKRLGYEEKAFDYKCCTLLKRL
nr:MAG TPA: Putative acetyltransferase [Caudoviricetes sp.]